MKILFVQDEVLRDMAAQGKDRQFLKDVGFDVSPLAIEKPQRMRIDTGRGAGSIITQGEFDDDA